MRDGKRSSNTWRATFVPTRTATEARHKSDACNGRMSARQAERSAEVSFGSARNARRSKQLTAMRVDAASAAAKLSAKPADECLTALRAYALMPIFREAIMRIIHINSRAIRTRASKQPPHQKTCEQTN